MISDLNLLRCMKWLYKDWRKIVAKLWICYVSRCFCDSYISESTICNSYCQLNTAPVISCSLQSDGTFAVSTYDPVTGNSTVKVWTSKEDSGIKTTVYHSWCRLIISITSLSVTLTSLKVPVFLRLKAGLVPEDSMFSWSRLKYVLDAFITCRDYRQCQTCLGHQKHMKV